MPPPPPTHHRAHTQLSVRGSVMSGTRNFAQHWERTNKPKALNAQSASSGISSAVGAPGRLEGRLERPARRRTSQTASASSASSASSARPASVATCGACDAHSVAASESAASWTTSASASRDTSELASRCRQFATACCMRAIEPGAASLEQVSRVPVIRNRRISRHMSDAKRWRRKSPPHAQATRGRHSSARRAATAPLLAMADV